MRKGHLKKVLRRWGNSIILSFSDKPLLKLSYIVIISLLLSILEKIVLRGMNIKEAIFTMLPSYLGELGSIDASNIIDAIFTLIALFVSITIVAVITARVSAYFVDIIEKGGASVCCTEKEDHTIICGWNLQGFNIVEQLIKNKMEIVILCERDDHPLHNIKEYKNKIEWIKGDPKNEKFLIEAGLERAKNVVILSNFNEKTPDQADAETLMIALMVESLNRKAHTIVQVMNCKNYKHFKNTNADEIICLDKIGGHISAASSINYGLSEVLDELLTFDDGNEFYKVPINKEFVGKSYKEVAWELFNKGIILIGFETDYTEEKERKLSNKKIRIRREGMDERKFINKILVVNPPKEYLFEEGDSIFVIAEEMPEI